MRDREIDLVLMFLMWFEEDGFERLDAARSKSDPVAATSITWRAIAIFHVDLAKVDVGHGRISRRF
jgi:hypothetical protein